MCKLALVSDDHSDWTPERYPAVVRSEVPDYERLQDEAAAATGSGKRRLLELGTGTGETALRVLARHPDATLVGVDASGAMLAGARAVLPTDRVQLCRRRLEDPLPEGPFDVVFSALAIHHLDGPGKSDLFGRVASVLAPGGRFVLADLVVPEEPAHVITPLEEGFDLPDTVADQLAWLAAAGLTPRVTWARRDLAVLVATCEPPAH
jgi:tRNA (cmo5U34)-methyltransferase